MTERSEELGVDQEGSTARAEAHASELLISGLATLLDEFRRSAGDLEYSPYDEIYQRRHADTRHALESLIAGLLRENERLRAMLGTAAT